MDEDQLIAHEELRQQNIDLKKSVDNLLPKLQELIDNYVAPKDELTVKGEVKVNTEKQIEVTNLELIKDYLENLGSELKESIKGSIVDEVTVKNPTKPLKTVSVDNLNVITNAVNLLTQKLDQKDFQPVVKVTKQDIKFPKSPTEAIPVRLSDGKGFYNAVFNAITQSKGVDDPLAAFQISDKDESTSTHYYGYARPNGEWYILKETSTAYRYATGKPRTSGGGLYSDAWTNRANLTYNYIYEVF